MDTIEVLGFTLIGVLGVAFLLGVCASCYNARENDQIAEV